MKCCFCYNKQYLYIYRYIKAIKNFSIHCISVSDYSTYAVNVVDYLTLLDYKNCFSCPGIRQYFFIL